MSDMQESLSKNAKIMSAGIAIALLLGAVAFFSQDFLTNGEGQKAMARAELLGQKLIDNKFVKVAPGVDDLVGGRGLASTVQKLEGEVGRDPWGWPFKYKVFVQEGGAKLVVWSNGDGASDKKSAEEIASSASRAKEKLVDNRHLILVMPFDKTIL